MRRNPITQNGKRKHSSNPANGKKPLVRLSANVREDQKDRWLEARDRAAEIDGIHNPDNGTYLARIIDYGLRLDQASLAEYVKTHKRSRDKDPRDKDPAQT